MHHEGTYCIEVYCAEEHQWKFVINYWLGSFETSVQQFPLKTFDAPYIFSLGSVDFVVRPSHRCSDDQGNDSRDRWLFYCRDVMCPKSAEKLVRKAYRLSSWADAQSQQMSTLKGETRSVNCVIVAPTSLFFSLCHAAPISSCLQTSLSLSLSYHHPTSRTSPPLSPADCLYLSSHPPWCFSPSLESMWLLRCLSICSPRQAQRAGATLWLLCQ